MESQSCDFSPKTKVKRGPVNKLSVCVVVNRTEPGAYVPKGVSGSAWYKGIVTSKSAKNLT